MTLIPWKNKRHEEGGNAPLVSFRSEMDRLFNNFFNDPFGMVETGLGALTEWTPTLDVTENESEITVRAELPGVKPEDLDVTVTSETLVLSGEKKETSEKKGQNYWHSESRYGSFRRQVRLPAEVDAENVEAKFSHGVLEVHLKKTAAAKSKRINVKEA